MIENITDKFDLTFSNKLKNMSTLKYFNDDKNTNGIYSAMNFGLEKAKGKYILFLNAGDRLFMKKKIIIKVLKDIINHFSTSNIICFSAFLELENDKVLLEPKRTLLYKMPTSHQAIIMKTSFLKSEKFNLNYKIAADFDLLTKISFHKLVFYKSKIPLTIIEYGGYASQNTLNAYFEYIKIILKNKDIENKALTLLLCISKFIFVFFLKSIISEKFLFKIKRYLLNV